MECEDVFPLLLLLTVEAGGLMTFTLAPEECIKAFIDAPFI